MQPLEKLQTISRKYNSDIEDHGYLEPLSKHLPATCRSFLEIGIARGDSALIWNDLYGGDDLDLHYLDLFINPEFVSPRWCRNRGFVPHIGSQADLRTLSNIQDQFSVIVDDGSHSPSHMWVSFKHLFLHNLLPEGVFFITDCHCCLDKYFWSDGVESVEDTPIHAFKEYLNTGKLQSKFLSEGESEVFESLIKSVHIEANEKMIVIYRKK